MRLVPKLVPPRFHMFLSPAPRSRPERRRGKQMHSRSRGALPRPAARLPCRNEVAQNCVAIPQVQQVWRRRREMAQRRMRAACKLSLSDWHSGSVCSLSPQSLRKPPEVLLLQFFVRRWRRKRQLAARKIQARWLTAQSQKPSGEACRTSGRLTIDWRTRRSNLRHVPQKMQGASRFLFQMPFSCVSLFVTSPGAVSSGVSLVGRGIQSAIGRKDQAVYFGLSRKGCRLDGNLLSASATAHQTVKPVLPTTACFWNLLLGGSRPTCLSKQPIAAGRRRSSEKTQDRMGFQ